jgi:hypothetical protein
LGRRAAQHRRRLPYDSEFEYASKNGRDLRRTYDHDVQLNADGSARITTKVTIRNTGDPGRFNEISLSCLSLYGPRAPWSTRRPVI